MAKIQIPSITEVSKFLTKEKFLPIYFLCGEDQYTIDLALDAIEKAVTPFVLSDFDKEVISAEKNQSLIQVLDLAFSFPFGGGKNYLLSKILKNSAIKRTRRFYQKSSLSLLFLFSLKQKNLRCFQRTLFKRLLGEYYSKPV